MVGTPLALFGAINHVVPYQIVKAVARKLSRDKDQWASNVVYPGLVVFPLCYLIQLGLAWSLLSTPWALLYTVALPYTGYYAVLFGDRVGRTWRRMRTFLQFLAHPGEQERLAAEGRAIVGRIRELGERLESHVEPDDSDAAVDASTADTGAGLPLFAMSATDLEAQFREDAATLREILDRLDELEREWTEARRTIQARTRGYFTPEEDDRVRRILFAYRSYRMVLYEIVNRYLDHDQLRQPADQIRGFMIAYAAGLTLYARSMRFIQAYADVPLIRAKLNEPDPRSGLKAGFFEEVMRAYTSLINYRRLADCGRYWLRHRRELRAAGLDSDAMWGWLAEVIRRQRAAVRDTFWYILRNRLRLEGRSLIGSLYRPVHRTRYGLRSFVAGTLAPMRLVLRYRPALVTEVLERLAAELRPGDVLLARSEHKLTTAVLPGFWCHAALYLGVGSDLEALGIARDEAVRPHLDELAPGGARFGYVMEAIAPRVRFTTLEKCLEADHVLLLRPNLPEADRRAAVLESFRHLGKAYDFEFDFNVPARVVCTELVYRCYNDRGGISLPLIKRLGRYTLSCDDIHRWLIEQVESAGSLEDAPMRPVCLVLQDCRGSARFVPRESLMPALLALRDGVPPGLVLQDHASGPSPETAPLSPGTTSIPA